MSQRIDFKEGPFRIIAGVANRKPQAIAYLGDRVVLRTVGESPDEPADRLRLSADRRTGSTARCTRFGHQIDATIQQLEKTTQ